MTIPPQSSVSDAVHVLEESQLFDIIFLPMLTSDSSDVKKVGKIFLKLVESPKAEKN